MLTLISFVLISLPPVIIHGDVLPVVVRLTCPNGQCAFSGQCKQRGCKDGVCCQQRLPAVSASPVFRRQAVHHPAYDDAGNLAGHFVYRMDAVGNQASETWEPVRATPVRSAIKSVSTGAARIIGYRRVCHGTYCTEEPIYEEVK